MSLVITAVVGIVMMMLLRLFFKPPFGKNVIRLDTEQRLVALTFDDGPHPPYTDRLLDVLAKHKVKATFFMIGNRIEKHPQTVHRVIVEGHQIGNHSYSHPVLGFRLPARIRREIERTDSLLRQLGAAGEIAFRAPMLTRFLPVAWFLAKADRAHISCNVWSWDWTTQNPDRIAQRVLKKTGPGSIIVLHDGKAENAHADRAGTLEATDRIITKLKRKKYRFCTIRDGLRADIC
ncbi:polysaccharide deacetylase family protein [Candidatus Poribacteria bacterium]|nr:polysaccharide deacetylase family protein [Candidatus Poribacteria bacterium]